MKYIFLILVLFFVVPAKTQTIAVVLNEPAIAKRDATTPLFIPTFKYNGPVLKDYSKFGIVDKRETPRFTITLPSMQNCMDTAFGFIYFGGANDNKGAYLTFLIGNYKRRVNKDAYLIIDRNNNHDFNDDVWDTLKWDEMKFTISLCNNEHCDYSINLLRFSFKFADKTKEPYKRMQDRYYYMFDTDSLYTGVDYGFEEKRMHFKKGLAVSGNDSFYIALRDVNENGAYNDPGDRIYLLNTSETVFDDDRYFEIEKGKTNFEWNRKMYKIVHISGNGNNLTFEADPEAKSKNKLIVGKKIPKFKFHPWDDVKKEISVKKYRRKELYIYFFKTQLDQFRTDSTYLNKIHEEFGKKITVLCLTVNDYERYVYRLRTDEKPQWKLGAASPELVRLYSIERLPQGVYCGKRRKLKNAEITPKELYELLKVKYP